VSCLIAYLIERMRSHGHTPPPPPPLPREFLLMLVFDELPLPEGESLGMTTVTWVRIVSEREEMMALRIN
jgi:hypothetical protein